MDDILETFKAKYVGRGVWYTVTKMVSCIILGKFSLTASKIFQLRTVHLFFMIYCQNIYCLICRYHAADFIYANPKNLESPFEYFIWLYNFHKAANNNAKKSSPSFKRIKNIYIDEEGDSELNFHDCQNGIWHFLFIVATKCTDKGQIVALYYLIIEFMSNIFMEQRIMFGEFADKHKFTDALAAKEISEIDLCRSLFDWIYALYADINSKSGEKVYDIETIRSTYYSLEYCTDNCDK